MKKSCTAKSVVLKREAFASASTLMSNYKKEEWGDIVGYEGLYKVSSKGRVRSVERYRIYRPGECRLVTGRILKLNRNASGYPHVKLYTNGKHKTFTVHRLVITAFGVNPLKNPSVNHIDGCKTNNEYENLEWVTHQENIIHAVDSGLKPLSQGENHRSSKLKVKDVLDIVLKASEGRKKTEIAREYGIARDSVYNILNGVTWRTVTGFPRVCICEEGK